MSSRNDGERDERRHRTFLVARFLLREARFPTSTSREVPNVVTLALLYTTAFVLGALWLMGHVSSYTLSAFIHVLLFLTILIVFLRAHSGRRPSEHL
jgi:hypothetical protein